MGENSALVDVTFVGGFVQINTGRLGQQDKTLNTAAAAVLIGIMPFENIAEKACYKLMMQKGRVV